uniref:3-mercaptopyruvate sulfurtransferase n=1 Tax=Pristiophorus japonicus TaxID=55135 RepID=UPI00398E411D
MALVRPVVSPAWLAEAVRTAKAGALRVLDTSWHLPTARRDGRREFEEKHIPGAAFFDLDECSDRTSPYDHMAPGERQFSQYASRLGIGGGTHVVVYDASELGLFSAPRVWWLFRLFGHGRVSVLDGGLAAWCREGLPVTAELGEPPALAHFQASAKDWVKTYQQVLDNIDKQEFQLVDARSEGRFRGTQPEPREDFEPGHIPGSINIPFTTFLNPETLKVRSEKELQRIFKEHKVDLTKPLVGTCGTGVTACHVALAAYLCGKEDTLIYDGAWMEWFKKAEPHLIISEGTEKMK